MRFKPYMMLALFVMLPACTPVDPSFGEAVRYDMAIQTINPDPVYPEGSAEPGASGTAAAAAAERYRKGTVKPVERISSTSGSSGSGPR